VIGIGSRVGPYEITGVLGAGGMGEVFRARDTKLRRDVAIKVLPESLAADPERRARFDREAQVLASLNHPNIGGIHGFEEAPSDSGQPTQALILELVEGPTLADRIAQGPIPLDEAQPIARQIAEGLEAAHELGVIHRDLKPANIKLRQDGVVKILDFGLAKLIEAGGAAQQARTSTASLSPTITTPAMTQVGLILGTAAYMSPEQARGRVVDRRADVWAFGCVFYEMLTGAKAFGGADVTDTIAAIVRAEPEWSQLPVTTPQSIRRLLRRCLAKDVRARLADMADARIEIEESASERADGVPGGQAAAGVAPWRRPAMYITAATTAMVTAVAMWLALRPRETPPAVVRLAVTHAGQAPHNMGPFDPALAISADGRRIAYVHPNERQSAATLELWTRSLDAGEPVQIKGAALPIAPFFSPNGEWIGYFDVATRSLAKISVNGGSAVRIAPFSGNVRGATWAADDTIIFATNDQTTGLLRVPAAGGTPEALTKVDINNGERDHTYPEIVPGGRYVVFTILGAKAGASQVAVLDLRTRAYKVVATGEVFARYAASGHLVFASAGVLRAVPFDLDRLEVTGDPAPVLDHVLTKSTGAADFALAANGTLVYASSDASTTGDRTLVWVNRKGEEQQLPVPPRVYVYPRISPDGSTVALDIRDQERDIWTWDVRRQTLIRLTVDPANDRQPLWSRDGRRILFASDRDGSNGIFSQAADGSVNAERLTRAENPQFPYAFSLDGTRLLVRDEKPATGADIGIATLGAGATVGPLLVTPFVEQNPEISPDGRWVAYESNESGHNEVYVRPFPDVASGRWVISNGGGTRPLWSRDGRELFYLTGLVRMMRVAITPGRTFIAGTPEPLFTGRYFTGLQGRTYDISPDGQRFLMIKNLQVRDTASDAEAAERPPELMVVLNWQEELKRLVPTR